MWNSRRLLRLAFLRALLLLFGLAGIFWSRNALPSFWLTTPARDIIGRIIADERFKPGLLAESLARMKNAPQPAIRQPELTQGEAVLALRTAEEAMQRRSSAEVDYEVEMAEDLVRASLSVTPSDSFLWLMLYSMETRRSGFDSANTIYLDQSYAVGPNEGWIAVRRNRLSLAVLSQLRASTQRTAVSEFSAMVDSDFIEEAVVNLMTVGWVHRDRLIKSLEGTDLASRRMLAKRLSVDVPNLRIPGAEMEDRPWR